jgi:class 3 adenylate cyclase
MQDQPEVATDERTAERSVLFTDVVASTRFMHRSGDAAWLRLLECHRRTTAEVSRSHGGEVVTFVGDGYMMSFDRPEQAVACALRLRSAFAIQDELGIRLGVNRGPVAWLNDGSLVGLTVHLASRFTDMGDAGWITMSEDSYQAARMSLALPLVPRREAAVRGVDLPVAIRVL